VKAAGLDEFRNQVVSMSPFLGDRIGELKSWTTSSSSALQSTGWRMVAAGADLHWRFSARHVADRRRRHQHRGPGRGRRREPPGGAAARRYGDG